MPVPETFLLYGQNNIVVPSAPTNPIASGTTNRAVTRTVTLHFTHGWRYNSNKGVHFWIDLDGSLYQNNEADRRYLHVSGGPYFNNNSDAVRNNNSKTVRNTSLGVEICRFGKFKARPSDGWKIDGYDNINFSEDTNDPEWCDYSGMGSTPAVSPGTRKFNLWKIPGGTTYQNDTKNYYKLKAAEFNDDRNPEKPKFLRDVLYTEEQLATLVLWLKSMLEHYRIPKNFLHDPVTGKENPWIDTDVLARRDQPVAIRNEAIERAASHQGIWGHMNLQRSRVDPGASMDYYRIKRGISDSWWYPVNLEDTTRAINYLDAARSADYLNLKTYGSREQLEDYYRLNENGETGFYPIGLNRVWHGGIHINSGETSKPVYAMANGTIVAARVSNGEVNGAEPVYSRCFVLIKHEVHTQDNGEEVSYAADSTNTIYTLYMHLTPLTITQREDGNGGQRWDFDYSTMPPWLCHFLIDNPTISAVDEGGLLYPNQKVDLSDHLGATGTYITGVVNNVPQYGRSVHLEVFSTVDPNTFGENPWSEDDNRLIDPTPDDALADESTLNSFIHDAAGDGIDTVDIKNAVPGMRMLAVQSRSEWSLTERGQLGHRDDGVTQTEWDNFVRPLCFHSDIVADSNAPAVQIGPFHGTTTVWHIHPFSFLTWMNERVERHEQILAEQDKSRGTFTPNIQISEGYITGFQNISGSNASQLPQNTGATTYAEVEFNELNYGVTVDALADQAALRSAAQTTTRFNLRLLDVLDICADRQHGLQVVEGYVSAAPVQCSDASHHAAHNLGDAVDLRPDNTAMRDWFNLYTSAGNAMTFMEEFQNQSLEMQITTDSDSDAIAQQELNGQAADLWQRLQSAESASDPLLTAAPEVQQLDKMRLHINVISMATASTATLENVRWLTQSGDATSGPALAGQRLRIEMQPVGIQDGSDVNVFIMSELFIKTIPPDINTIANLQSLYGSRNFDLDQIERHELKPNAIDTFVQRIQKKVSGVDGSARATVVCDWQVPESLPHGTGRLYAVCIVGAGANRTSGGTTTEHTMGEVTATAQITVPHIIRSAWATNASGTARVNAINIRQHSQAYITIDTVALPAGCELNVKVRDLKDNSEVLNSTTAVGAGNLTSIVSCPVPGRKGAYHATVTVNKADDQIQLTSGAGVEWTR